jgi:hypothetical protein
MGEKYLDANQGSKSNFGVWLFLNEEEKCFDLKTQLPIELLCHCFVAF